MRRVFLYALAFSGCSVLAADGDVNLALYASGGMPTALASVPNARFSPQQACDGKANTGWVSAMGSFPVWLRVEWRTPVEVREVAFLQFPDCPFKEVGPVGEYAVELQRAGRWEEAARGNAAKLPLDQAIRHKLAQPVKTAALRLRIDSAPTGQAAVAELAVLGPEVLLPVELAPKWQAKWIWSEPSLYIPHREPVRRYLRRSFTIDDPAALKGAWLLACAFDRLNQLWVNNRPALRHGALHGGSFREAQVRRIPLDWLTPGENVLAAAVDDLYEVGSHGLLAELILIGKDGTRTVIPTDEQWVGQEDQGKIPDWRKPGFKETRWGACRVMHWPNTRWHWSWNVPRPTVAPQEELTVAEFAIAPQPVKPGATVELSIVFECAATPGKDYAILVLLGQPSFWRNHDFDLGGAYLLPEQVKTSQWQPGRRRVSLSVRIPQHAPRDAPASLLVTTPEGAAGLRTGLPGLAVDSYGLHFAIQVDRGPVAAPHGGGFPRCEVRTVAGNPTLHINDEPTAPILWTSSYGNYRRYSEYSATGVKLFRPLIQGSPLCAPGEETEFCAWWFKQVDRMLSAAVAVDPEIKLLPAVWMDPNPAWLFERPSEQMLGGRGSLVVPLSLVVPDRGQVRPTFMSQAWRRAGGEALARLVRHMRSQPYAPNVIGVCLFAGRAGENYWGGNERNIFINEAGKYDAKPRNQWEAGDFSMAARRTFRDFLMAKYGTDEALRRAWQQPDVRFDDILEPARFDREEACDILTWAGKPEGAGSVRDPLEPGVGTLPMDYRQCFSEAMIDTFAAWGEAVKEASDGRLITGCFYGYALAQLFTAVPGFHGHTAVARSCATPHLDFYVSPSEYNWARRPGGPFWGHNIIDSLRLHNKLWIYEQDTRTYLAHHMPRTFSRDATIEILKRDTAASLTRNVGWWWYEFAEGQTGSRSREWFIDGEIAKFARRIKRVYDYSLTLPDRGPSAEIAVFYHGESLTAQDLFPPTLQLNIAAGRLTLVNGMQRVGAPYDFYNLADIPKLAQTGLLRQYKVCLFLNACYLTRAERESLELCKSDGRVLVWLGAPGLARVEDGISPEHVADVTGIRGVKWLQRKAEQTYSLAASDHPVLNGFAAHERLSAVPFPPGSTWERFGNEVWPVLYVDPGAVDEDTRVLGWRVLDGETREDMGALCVRTVKSWGRVRWRSIHAVVPYLTPELMRNIARFAGAHVWRDANDILFASPHFVAVHTGQDAATGELRLPRRTDVYDVFGARVVAEGADSIGLNVPPRSTVVYHLGDARKFEAALAAGE